MTGPHLVYFADPMCSWCWGFSPVIEAVERRFGDALPIRLILGGLRPGTVEPMDQAAKDEIRAHWDHVHEASGQPFDPGFFDRRDFVYDTEPPSRAVVVVRRRGAAEALAFLRRVHAAFYAENRDVTDEAVLAELASQSGLERGAFLEAFRGDEAKRETRLDFAIARQSGITGFPSLIAGAGDPADYAVVTRGYQPADRIIPPLEDWARAHRAPVERAATR